MKTVDTGHIVVDPEVLGGEPHIAGHRIGVSNVAIWVTCHHAAPEEVAQRYHLTLGEVHAALAYYYDHKDEIDRGIAETNRRAAEMAKRYPRGWSPALDSAEQLQ
jgi:uncharacterized protein (DUF433 family)